MGERKWRARWCVLCQLCQDPTKGTRAFKDLDAACAWSCWPGRRHGCDAAGVVNRLRVTSVMTDYSSCARHPSPRRSRPTMTPAVVHAGTGTPT
jgi:hypothetical protein